jgi:hypothetical protein
MSGVQVFEGDGVAHCVLVPPTSLIRVPKRYVVDVKVVDAHRFEAINHWYPTRLSLTLLVKHKGIGWQERDAAVARLIRRFSPTAKHTLEPLDRRYDLLVEGGSQGDRRFSNVRLMGETYPVKRQEGTGTFDFYLRDSEQEPEP